MTGSLAIGLAGLASVTVVCAEAVKPPPRTVRLLAVGENPPFRQEIRDGVAYELEPPPGSLPPFDVATRPPAKPGSDEPSAAAGQDSKMPAAHSALRLGRITAPLLIPPGEGPFEILRFENGVPGKPWVRLQRPESGNLLVVFWRAAGQENWDSPSAMILPDGPDEFPAGTVRIVNLFPQAVRIAFAGELLNMEPRKNLLKPVKPNVGGDSAVFQVLVPDASGRAKRYYSGAVTQQPGERGIIVIHRADGIAPRRPLIVTNLREPRVAAVPVVQPATDGGQ